MALNEYFEAQKNNLRSSSNWEPFVTIFPLVDDLYGKAIKLVPNDRPVVFGQLLLVCHKSFLSAAALIGQAQPEDAGPITRRAIEAACHAAIFRTDPRKVEKWMAHDQRMKRWADRREGKKPVPLQLRLGDAHPGIKQTIEGLMAMVGALSDYDVHFTPEFTAKLAWNKRKDSMYLNYFTKEQRELERSIVLTSGVHLQILEVMDWCFDGAFKSDSSWSKQAENLRRTAKPWTQEFEHSAEAGIRTADHGEKRLFK